MYLIECITRIVAASARAAFPELAQHSLDVEITLATQEQFGHYQCNSAMKWAKLLKKSPREIAQILVDTLPLDIFESVKVAGPGFINLTLTHAFLSEKINEMLKHPRLGAPLPKKKQRIIVEFSSPNIAKEMHVGHLRSTIIGECLARLFEFLGHDVVRLNHIGDWGTAFGMLIIYMQQEAVDVLKGDKTATVADLMRWYRASKKCFDEDEEFKLKAREAVVQLQAHAPALLEGWERICAISREAFEQVYTLLDVKLEERGESYYNSFLPQIVADLEQKGLVEISEGAKCIFHEGLGIPLMVQKADGGYNYDTTDIAALFHRIVIEKADRIIVVTDAGQNLHFELVRKTAQKAGYLDPDKVRFDHVPFGVVLAPDGKKFRTRSGETEKLIDLLTASITTARALLEQRELKMEEKELDHLAHVLGIDAIKYADLCCNRLQDYVFSYERMLRFEGNTAAFILYSYVRINGIKRKMGHMIDVPLSKGTITLTHPSEIALGLHLMRFAEILQLLENDLMPHYLTDYLYTTAQKFNVFFRDCRVEGDPAQQSRLLLCQLVSSVMARALHILGLHTVARM